MVTAEEVQETLGATGYNVELDDAYKNPWSDYKKGAIDLILALLTMWTSVNYNTTLFTSL